MDKLAIEYNGYNKISLSRELDADYDIDKVDERENSLIFIFGCDDFGWTFYKDKAILKLRFKYADEIKPLLVEATKNSILFLDLFRVHRFEVSKNEATPEKELELKNKVKLLLDKSFKSLDTYMRG